MAVVPEPQSTGHVQPAYEHGNTPYMKYEAHKKANKKMVILLVSCQLLVIIGFLYAMDWLRKPSFIGYLFIAFGVFQVFRLIRQYNKPGLRQRS